MTPPENSALLSPRLSVDATAAGRSSAAATTDLPIILARMVSFSLEGQAIVKPEDRPWARYCASPDSLDVMHTQLISGRGLSATDSAGNPLWPWLTRPS